MDLYDTNWILQLEVTLKVIIAGVLGGIVKDVIEGLTTAASLLLVAAVGVAVAMGQLLLAGLVTIVSLIVLRVVGRMMSKR